MKKSDYWRHSTDTKALLAILLMISRVLVHPFANILSISSPMQKQLSWSYLRHTLKYHISWGTLNEIIRVR